MFENKKSINICPTKKKLKLKNLSNNKIQNFFNILMNNKKYIRQIMYTVILWLCYERLKMLVCLKYYMYHR